MCQAIEHGVMHKAMEHGVELKCFHTDNGTFKSKAFVKALKDNCQMITKLGVGAHHQNGVAERDTGPGLTVPEEQLSHGRDSSNMSGHTVAAVLHHNQYAVLFDTEPTEDEILHGDS